MSREPERSLADRVAAFRDEVLAAAADGDREPPGSEVFDAVLRFLSASGPGEGASAAGAGRMGAAGGARGGAKAEKTETTEPSPPPVPPGPPGSAAEAPPPWPPGPPVARGQPLALDLALHDGIARRLAWQDSELRVLSDAREVCRRLLAAARRALRDPHEEMEVARAVAEAGSAAARILILLVLGRVARERAALLREELAHDRLEQAIERQRQELGRLERALGGKPPP
ncbi:MAG TPA: hypothetical protein VKB80_08545 [Kofleriaceae bacterium]|nr:hypothetical protein [Kofleriaceae bacterium]